MEDYPFMPDQPLHRVGIELADVLTMSDMDREWKFSPIHATSANLVSQSDDWGIHLYLDGDKISITGNYPRREWNNSDFVRDTPNINVSVNKDPIKIVKDIQNRFLPLYAAKLKEAQELERTYLDRIDFIQQATAQLAEVWEGKGSPQRNSIDRDPTSGNVRFGEGCTYYGTMEISSYSKQVTLEIRNMSLELALALGREFNRLTQEGKGK